MWPKARALRRLGAVALAIAGLCGCRGIATKYGRVGGTLLIITHSTRIVDALTVDAVQVRAKGVIVKNGGPDLIESINEKGFAAVQSESAQ